MSWVMLFLTTLPSEALPSGLDLTELTKRAADLEMGMRKCEVYSLLGKPTWLIGVGEDEEIADLSVSEWRWDNDRCNPVAVMFHEPQGIVSGWDEGRAFCAESTESMPFRPEDKFLVTDQVEIGCE